MREAELKNKTDDQNKGNNSEDNKQNEVNNYSPRDSQCNAQMQSNDLQLFFVFKAFWLFRIAKKEKN